MIQAKGTGGKGPFQDTFEILITERSRTLNSVAGIDENRAVLITGQPVNLQHLVVPMRTNVGIVDQEDSDGIT